MKKILYIFLIITFLSFALLNYGQRKTDPLKTNLFNLKSFPQNQNPESIVFALGENKKATFSHKPSNDLTPFYFSIKNVGDGNASGHCSEFAKTLAILANQIGLSSRVFFFEKHAITEIYYQGDWHMSDASRKIYLRKSNNKIASINDIFNNIALVNQIKNEGTKNFYKEFLVNKNIVEVENYEADLKNSWEEKISYALRPNEEIRFYYNWPGKYFYRENNNPPETFTNGLLISPLETGKILFKKPSVKSFQLPYPILASYVSGKGLCNRHNQLQFSLNQKDWINVKKYCQDDILRLVDVFPKGKNAKITNHYFLKLKLSPFSGKAKAYTQFQVAPKSIPRLQDGENIIELKSLLSQKASLRFAYHEKKSL
jgi:hypothetical protein